MPQLSRPSVRLSVCLSVRPSVTFRYVFHTGWNTSKIISQFISVRLLFGLTPTWAIVQPENPKLGWNEGGIMSTKTCNISETVQDRTKIIMTN